MVRHLIVLDDGTNLFSGIQGENAIARVTLTQKVNDGQELKPGAVCADVLEVELLTPAGGLHIPIGSELALCEGNSAGAWEQVGLFTVGDVIRPSTNRYLVTAYDRLSWLDKDLTEWVDNLDGWPYRLQTFAQMVCEACGLYLQPGYFTNGEWPVHRFSVVNVTGRKLMQWVGELSCRFCRATPDGEIVLDWYAEAEDVVLEGEDGFVFLEPFSSADYLTDVIDKVIIRADNKERGFTYGTGSNAYVITGNLLMAVVPNESFEGLARVIYEHLRQIQYTPCTIAVPLDVRIKCGDTLWIMDRNGVEILMYVMKKTQCGQKNILECTGSPRRRNRL